MITKIKHFPNCNFLTFKWIQARVTLSVQHVMAFNASYFIKISLQHC